MHLHLRQALGLCLGLSSQQGSEKPCSSSGKWAFFIWHEHYYSMTMLHHSSSSALEYYQNSSGILLTQLGVMYCEVWQPWDLPAGAEFPAVDCSSIEPVACRRSSKSALCFSSCLLAVYCSWAIFTAALFWAVPASESHTHTCLPWKLLSDRSNGLFWDSWAHLSFHIVRYT